MSFDGMASYRNSDPTESLWAVAKNGLAPVRKYKVLKETAKTFVLEDGTVVRKEAMRNNYQLFYTNETSAEIVYRNIRKAFDPAEPECESNFEIVTNATIETLPNILIDMIHELCEDGMPSAETVKEWLLNNHDKNGRVNEEIKETSEDNELVQEDYSNLKDGDTVYYVDFNGNKVIQGVALGVRRKHSNSSMKYFSIDVPNDFMGCSGELLGEKVFINKELAERKLREGNQNV
jgi:hypothetical protein